MNDAKIDALERMTRTANRKGDIAAAMVMNLALVLRNSGDITDEQYEELKRQRERMESV